MKILLHARSTGGGGAERVMSVLAEGLAARGHDVTFAVDVLDPVAGEPRGARVVVLPRGHAAATIALARLFREKPDAVVAGLALAVVRSALAKVLTLSRVPLVISYHGFEENKLGGAGPLAYSGMPILGRIATRVVCVSDALSAFMVSRWGAPKDRTLTLYNPVALPELKSSPLPAAERPPVVAAVGRLSPEKGMGDLIRAFALCRTPEARLVIAGDGPEADMLRALARGSGIEARTSFVGWVENAADVFLGARVAVVPSLSEAFSLVTVEALAAGASVIATDCGGPREILADGRYGRIVPVADPKAMAEAIDAALADPGDTDAGVTRARDFAAEGRIDAWERLLGAIAG